MSSFALKVSRCTNPGLSLFSILISNTRSFFVSGLGVPVLFVMIKRTKICIKLCINYSIIFFKMLG